MKRKTWLVVLFLVVVLASVIAVAVVDRDSDMQEAKPEFSLSAAQLIDAFAENEMEADRLYSGKILEVHGAVKAVITDESAPILLIGDREKEINISCYLQSEPAQQYEDLQKGDFVKVKGVCNGMLTDIMLDRSILVNP